MCCSASSRRTRESFVIGSRQGGEQGHGIEGLRARAYVFVACICHFAIDHASLARPGWGGVLMTGGRGGLRDVAITIVRHYFTEGRNAIQIMQPCTQYISKGYKVASCGGVTHCVIITQYRFPRRVLRLEQLVKQQRTTCSLCSCMYGLH